MSLNRKALFGLIILLISAGLALALIINSETEQTPEQDPEPDPPQAEEPTPVVDSRVIGSSVEGRMIEAHTYYPVGTESGQELDHVVFVGGIHGGYEWNSVLIAYRLMDRLIAEPELLPSDVKITIVPSANPDGVYTVVGTEGRFSSADVSSFEATIPGRFNANSVDLNRNFDCNWAPESTWRGETVSAGTEPFSEPEAQAIRDLVLASSPEAVIFWHSAAGAVYGSECHDGVLPSTRAIMNAYAEAAGYPAVPTFDHYPITGDAEGWLASLGIPAITVEFTTHDDMEWERNKAGVMAVLEYFSDVD